MKYKKTITLRIELEDFNKLEIKANESKCSTSAIIRKAISQYLEKE